MDKRNVLDLFEQNKEQIEDRINSGIEANRKGWATVTVKDENGNPIKNTKIKIKQKNHEFRYGANIFMLDELETNEKNEMYKKYFKECFNMATIPFYWKDLEPEKGKQRYEKDSPKIYRRPAPDLCMEFCEENGIEPREHGLAYESCFPEWLRGADTEVVKKEFARRCKEIAERYADRIDTIEVTNETDVPWHVTDFYEEPEFVEWCFKTTRRYFTGNKLAINEHTPDVWNSNSRGSDRYYLQIENALLKGAEIDAIGMQYHNFFREEDYYESTRKNYDPFNLFKVLDTYAKFNKDIQITEITIPCYSDKEEDELLQAEIIEKLYSLWFSHKNVSQIIYWNLVDGYAAGAVQGDMTSGENYYRGGLIRFDFTPKPSYYKIKELFEKKWHTELELTTDEEGKFKFKGFYGGYDLEIEGQNKEIKLRKKGENKLVITK